MRIFVFGNSHVASLKSGWDAIASDYSDLHLTFFASRGLGLEKLKLVQTQLVPQTQELAKDLAFTSGGMDRVDLEACDIFLTYGLGLRLDMPLLDPRCSNAVMRQARHDTISKSLNIRLCNTIREGSTKPIYIGHNPQLAISNPKPESRVNKLTYSQILNLLNDELELERSTIVGQPQETLAYQWFTKQKYSVDSTRLNVGDKMSGRSHSVSEVQHMNTEFGKLWLEQFFRIISNT